MFTLEEIKKAHSKVKSGADFPAYIQELKKMGITSYEIFVEDGHAIYEGMENETVIAPPRYESLVIASAPNKTHFQAALRAHQNGETDYATFCKHAAESGVAKWVVSTKEMTCTYFDTAGKSMLVEAIPE